MNGEYILKKIRKDFPNLKWTDFRYISHGLDHKVVILDEKIVFRIPINTKHRNAIPNEIKLLRYLKKKIHIGIPEYSFISKNKALVGYNILAGKELTASRFKRLTISQKEIIAKQLASFFNVLHKTPSKYIEAFHVSKISKSKLKNRYDGLVSSTKLILSPKLNKSENELIKKYFIKLNNAFNQGFQRVLVHGDIKPEHLLWGQKNNRLNIIDFSDRSFDDPARDFAGLHIYGQKFVRDVFNLYKGRKDEQFLQRSQIYFKQLPLYIMINALKGKSGRFMKGHRMFKQRFGS